MDQESGEREIEKVPAVTYIHHPEVEGDRCLGEGRFLGRKAVIHSASFCHYACVFACVPADDNCPQQQMQQAVLQLQRDRLML